VVVVVVVLLLLLLLRHVCWLWKRLSLLELEWLVSLPMPVSQHPPRWLAMAL